MALFWQAVEWALQDKSERAAAIAADVQCSCACDCSVEWSFRGLVQVPEGAGAAGAGALTAAALYCAWRLLVAQAAASARVGPRRPAALPLAP